MGFPKRIQEALNTYDNETYGLLKFKRKTWRDKSIKAIRNLHGEDQNNLF